MRKYFFLLVIAFYATTSNSQNVGVGTSNPQNKLHVAGGFRLDTLTGVNGAGLLRHDANGVVYGIKFSGNVSDVLRGDGTFGNYDVNGSIGWLLSGNSGTNPATNFIGTTDNQPLLFRVNNIRYGFLGNGNIFFGSNAGIQTTGNGNIAIGTGAFRSAVNSIGGIAIGDSALANAQVGSNVAIGYRALSRSTSVENVAIGSESLRYSSTGSGNTAVGTLAMWGTTTAFWNTAVGRGALAQNNAEENTAIGFQTLFDNKTGIQNTALGSRALISNIGGYFNTAIGASAALGNKEGHDLTAVGFRSMYLHQGNTNTALGAFSLSNGAGNNNIAIGYKAMENNSGSCCNTVVGLEAMIANGFGSFNTVYGYQAMNSNKTGSTNVALGYRALAHNNSGASNVAVGYFALSGKTFASNNTAVGNYAGLGLPDGIVNSVCVGYETGWNTTSSNQVNIGNFSISWIGGQTGWFHYSDKRIKNDIKEDVPGLSFITRLKPISYHVDIRKQEEIANIGIQTNQELIKPSPNANGETAGQSMVPAQKDWEGKYDVEKIKMTGFFAQDVEEAAKAINYSFSGVHNPKNGGLYSLDYSAFVVPLVKAVQEQQKIIEDQSKKIDKQQQQIDLLIKEMQSLRKDLITQKN